MMGSFMKKTTRARRQIPVIREGARRGVDLVAGVKALGGIGPKRNKIEPAAIEIGARIRIARIAAGLTQSKLAKQIGCNQGDLSDIERGQGRDGPSYRLLRSIAEALGIELPINPDVSEPVVIEADASEDVQHSGADFTTFTAVFTQHEWDDLRYQCLPEIKLHSHQGNLSRCVMVTMGPKAHIRRMVADTPVVVARVRGDGKVKLLGGRARKLGRQKAGCGMAVLGQGDSMAIDAAADQSLSMMVLPAHLMAERLDDQEEKGQRERLVG